MTFYEVEVNGATVGCELTLAAAKALARDHDPDWCIIAQEVPVTADTVRRLLGNLGGYATSTRFITP